MEKLQVLKGYLQYTIEEIRENIEVIKENIEADDLSSVCNLIYKEQMYSTIIALSLVESIINEIEPQFDNLAVGE